MSKLDHIKQGKINDIDLEEMAKQIAEGFTSGRLDSLTDEGQTKYIAWKLKTNCWIE